MTQTNQTKPKATAQAVNTAQAVAASPERRYRVTLIYGDKSESMPALSRHVAESIISQHYRQIAFAILATLDQEGNLLYAERVDGGVK